MHALNFALNATNIKSKNNNNSKPTITIGSTAFRTRAVAVRARRVTKTT